MLVVGLGRGGGKGGRGTCFAEEGVVGLVGGADFDGFHHAAGGDDDAG